jgi:DNA polymerase III delta prime subunit
LKVTFQKFVDQKNIPNLLLTGGPGVGKTTVAKAMLNELGCDYIEINGSMNGNIDTLRNEIMNFASTVSLMGGRKYVILDEADYLNANSTQPALRNFMEEFSRNCGFILTCNYKNKIIQPLHSRCSVIEFKISKTEMLDLAGQFMKRVMTILDQEGVGYDKKVLGELIKKDFPDWRRILNELQRYSANGVIDTGILVNLQRNNIKELIGFMKEKNFTEVRKWTKNNMDADVNTLFEDFYTSASEYFTPRSIPALVILLGRYQYQNAFAANPEINFVAFLAEAMIELEFK